MKWFKRMIVGWVREDWENVRNVVSTKSSDVYIPNGRGPNEICARGMNFTIYPASGGHVVEIRDALNHFDTPRNEHTLHVIHSDKDLGEALAHILTFETLKR